MDYTLPLHVYRNEQQEGPHSWEELQSMLASGHLTSGTLVWQEGMADWTSLESVMQLATPETPSPAVTPMHTRGPKRVFRPPGAPQTVPTKYGPVGVGGWLTFFCVGLVVLGPIINLSIMVIGWRDASPLFEQFPALKHSLRFEQVSGGGITLLGFIIGTLIWSGNRHGRTLARIYLLARLIWLPIAGVITFMIGIDLPDNLLRVLFGDVVPAILREVIYFTIWWLYFWKSVRVKNTYASIP